MPLFQACSVDCHRNRWRHITSGTSPNLALIALGLTKAWFKEKMILSFIQVDIPTCTCNIYTYLKESATLNSPVISLLAMVPFSPCPTRGQIPQPFDHLWNLKASATHVTRPGFLSPKPTVCTRSEQAGCTHSPTPHNGGFSGAREKWPAKTLRGKYRVQSRKLMLTSDVQIGVGKVLAYFRQNPVISLNNTVVNLNKIKKRSNPVDKCFG